MDEKVKEAPETVWSEGLDQELERLPLPRYPAVGDDVSHCSPEEALGCVLDTIRDLHAAGDLDGGLRRVAERLREGISYDTLAVLLLDDRGGSLTVRFASGYDREVTEHWRFGLGQGIVGTAARTGEVIWVPDVREDPRHIRGQLQGGVEVRSELAVPLKVQDRVVGVLDLGSRQPDFFSPEERRVLRVVAGQLAGAIENSRLLENMRSQAQTLSVLHQVSRELTAILDRERLLQTVHDRMRELIDYDVFEVLLWNEESRLLEPAFLLYGGRRHGEVAQSVPLGHGISGTAAALRQPLRVSNVHQDPRYLECLEGVPVRSELAVPLVAKERLVGVLLLDSLEYDAFTAQHEQLVATLAASLGIALENARLYEQVQANEQRLAEDLSTAREIQKRLLPKASPWIPGLQVAVAYEPARQLGGDFYDFLSWGKDGALFAVGDVAGKSTPAALYGALALGMLREVVAQRCCNPSRVLAEMNAKLCPLGIDNRFVALGLMAYEPSRGRLTLASSGLPHPHLVRDGEVEPLRVEGVPLGLLTGREYEETVVELEPGDVVVMCSDGIEESLDGDGEEMGRPEFRQQLLRLAQGDARVIADGLLAAADRHADRRGGGGVASDDRTVMVLKVV